MILHKKSKSELKIITGFLFLSLMSLSVQAAKYEAQEENSGGFNAEAFSDIFESKEKQTVEQLKKNYLEVLLLVKEKQLEKAQKKVNLLISESPKQSLYYNLRALLQLLDKDELAAEKSFVKAVGINQQNIQAHAGIAKIALNRKQYDKAKKHADKVLELNPYSMKAYQILADVEMKQKGLDEVEKFLLAAQIKVKQEPDAELGITKLLAKLYSGQKQPDKALKLAVDLAEKNNTHIPTLSFLAFAQLTNKDDMATEKTLRKIIGLDEKDVKHRVLLVRLLDKQEGKDNEMLALLNDAAQHQENPALVLSYKTAILIKQKKFQDALAVAQTVDKANPKISIGKILLADVYFADKKYDKALSNYKSAYEITPNIKLLDAILKVYKVQKNNAERIALLENELDKNKDSSAIKYRLAVAYQELIKYEQAVTLYEELLEVQSDNVVILNNLAWIYNQQNNPNAIKVAKKAHETAPKSGTVADTYGYILLKQGNKKKALEVLKLALSLDPVLPDIQLHLAEAFLANQNKDEAKQLLEQLVIKESRVKHQASRLLEML